MVVWGVAKTQKLFSIKKSLDPKGLFQCKFCVGWGRDDQVLAEFLEGQSELAEQRRRQESPRVNKIVGAGSTSVAVAMPSNDLVKTAWGFLRRLGQCAIM